MDRTRPLRRPSHTSMEEQQDLTEKVAQGHEAELVVKALDQELAKRRAQIEKDIFLHLEGDSPLSGDKAVQAWLELHAVHRLEQHLRKKVKTGLSASKRMASQLDPVGDPVQPVSQRFPHT